MKRNLLLPAVLAVSVLTGCTGDAESTDAGRGAAAPSANPSASAAQLGEAVDNGRLEVAFTEFACEPGSDSQRCRLTVRVKNGSELQQSFIHTEQFLIDDGGTLYTASAAAMTEDPASAPVLEPVAAGQTVTGIIHYDIPSDAVITTARLTEAGREPTDYDLAAS